MFVSSKRLKVVTEYEAFSNHVVIEYKTNSPIQVICWLTTV